MTDQDPLIGTELGDYRPIRLLGRGGMGAVYEADDLSLRRRVALKVLLPEVADDARARERFQREIDHAVAIEHPHVVPVYAAGFDRPHFYIAMRMIDGPDLNKLLRDGPLDQQRALRILGQIANALHATHAKGLVHRDVKPHNVLLWSMEGEEEHAMLTDFGIAKALDDTRSLTGVAAIGTPAYMAPEVCLGRLASPASDQYSLGCMAYELLSGRPPFDVGASELRSAHVEQPAVPLRQVVPSVSEEVSNAVAKALAKNPSDRHADVRAFVHSAAAARESFSRSQRITDALSAATQRRDAAETLISEHRLSDAYVSAVTELDATEIAKIRRRQARRALVGRRPR
jgi:serine/threonine-protein kinase